MPDTALPFTSLHIAPGLQHSIRLPLRSTHDLYGGLHKGLRFALCHLLVRLGATDWTNLREAQRMAAAVRGQLVLSMSHLAHEEEHIHSSLELRAPDAIETLSLQHDHHCVRLREIGGIVRDLMAADEALRPRIGRELYLTFSLFVSEDLAHMYEEEMTTLPVLQTLFTDEELVQMEGRILDSIPADELLDWLRRILPAMSRPERGDMLASLRRSAPKYLFRLILDEAARPTLEEADWADLVDRLSLQAA